MHPVEGSQPNGSDYDICDKCKYKGQDKSQGKTWLGPTPFKVQVESGGNVVRVSVDFSSTVVMDNNRDICDISKLELAVYDESHELKAVA